MKQRFKALLAALVGAALLAAPALAAAEPQTQQEFAPWAYSAVADSYAMGLVDDGYGTYITSPITQEQLESMTAVVAGKLALAVYAKERGIPLISSMGTGNKLHPERFRIADISETSVCPLCRVMRRELKKRGILHLKVVFSDETPRTPDPVRR